MPTIEAKITKVQKDETSDWYRISTDHKTVKRLDTREVDHAREAAALKKADEVAVIEFNERESKRINPHTNTPYIDRYYVAAKTQQMTIDDGIELVRETQRPTDPATAWRISLAAGAKLAVGSISAMKQEPTFDDLKTMALVWGHFLYTTPFPDGAPPAASLNGESQPAASEPFLEEDDIPFTPSINELGH